MKKEQAEEKTIVCLMNPPVVELNKTGLSNGNCGYGLTDDFLGMKPTSAKALKAKRKRFACMGLISSALVISNVVTALLCKLVTKPSHPTTVVLACPSKWVGYEGKCYYFSESEGTWDSSQSNCSASGASLAAIEDQKEMDFLMQCKRATDYWIGLKRQEGQPWQWANGSIFSGWFEIRTDGFCAYLNDEKASSTWCSTQRNWICSKSIYMDRRKLSEDFPALTV